MTEEKVIQIYRDVLDGKRVRFPNHFYVGDQGKKYLAFITRSLIEEYLEIPVEEIPGKVKAETLWKHRLRPNAHVHGWNFIEVIENENPGKFQPLEFKQVPNNYWCGENGRNRAIEVIRYMIEKECKITHYEITYESTIVFFKISGLLVFLVLLVILLIKSLMLYIRVNFNLGKWQTFRSIFGKIRRTSNRHQIGFFFKSSAFHLMKKLI